MAFTSWRDSPWFLDPISQDRKAKKLKGASNFPLPEIFQIITNLENLDTKNSLVWRGQANISWPLMSTLQRFRKTFDAKSFEAEEEELYKLALDRGIGQSEYGRATQLQTFAELQHHGVPTHLLDVTQDPLIALWFACRNSAQNKPGILFAISIAKFTQRFTSDPETMPVGLKDPSYIKPSAPDKRMLVQRAAFILPIGPTSIGSDGTKNFTLTKGAGLTDKLRTKAMATEGVNPPNRPPACHFVAIEIPVASKQWIIDRLESGGKITHASLFPDTYGLAQTFVKGF